MNVKKTKRKKQKHFAKYLVQPECSIGSQLEHLLCEIPILLKPIAYLGSLFLKLLLKLSSYKANKNCAKPAAVEGLQLPACYHTRRTSPSGELASPPPAFHTSVSRQNRL